VNGEIAQSLARIQEATGRLLATLAQLADAQLREPSLLPGWSRGHVLTHVARNADGLANLLRWARTGTEIPMYASSQARSAGIEAGAGRAAAELAADLRESAARFAEQAASLPGDAWAVQVRALTGPAFPACEVLQRRWSEVEIHHVDLAAGYRPGDWPGDFIAATLPRVTGSFTGRSDAPACLVWADGAPSGTRIGPDRAGGSPLTVSGPPAELLAWLLGRGSGAGLRVPGDAARAPVLPPWR
jgi:maleylpyruvate isomerase